MKKFNCVTALIFLVASPEIALAKQCADGKYRPVCPVGLNGPKRPNRPTIIPVLKEYGTDISAYKADLASYRSDVERERKTGAINLKQYNQKMNTYNVANMKVAGPHQ